MVHNQATNFRSLAARFVFGSIAPALATLAFFGLHLASTAFADVIAIVPAPPVGKLLCGAVPAVMSVAGVDLFSLRRSSDSGLQFVVVAAGCLADLVDAGAEQPGSRRRSHHPKRDELGE
jgi:hypothetical protein